MFAERNQNRSHRLSRQRAFGYACIVGRTAAVLITSAGDWD
jgi:hypothetical protein